MTYFRYTVVVSMRSLLAVCMIYFDSVVKILDPFLFPGLSYDSLNLPLLGSKFRKSQQSVLTSAAKLVAGACERAARRSTTRNFNLNLLLLWCSSMHIFAIASFRIKRALFKAKVMSYFVCYFCLKYMMILTACFILYG